MSPSDVPETIVTLAEGCRHFVKHALGVDLDGTPDTLPILDHYLERARASDTRSRAEVLGLVATSTGAYFGEVVRACIPGARWRLPDEDAPEGWRLEAEHVWLAVRPVAMVRSVITERDADGAELVVRDVDRDVLARSLDHVGPVDTRDYHRLTVRWEAIAQAIAVLETAALARGETERRYGWAEYAAVLDEVSR